MKDKETRGPQRYVEHLSRLGYHPRSNKHGDFLAQAVLLDLLASWPRIGQEAADGHLVFKQNHDVTMAGPELAEALPPEARNDMSWNIDLAVGPPAGLQPRSRKGKDGPGLIGADMMQEGVPGEVWLVLDAKGVMTEHGKARRNRQRDLTALWTVMKTFLPEVVVGGVVPINVAHEFRSPLRDEVTAHVNIEKLVTDTLAVFRAVRHASGAGGQGIDGLGCFVVDFTNREGARAKLVEDSPAPKPGDSIHYETMIKGLGQALVNRFGEALGT